MARDLGINVNSLYTWKFRYAEHPQPPQVAKMAQWLNVSRSGYYAWRKRHPGLRDMESKQMFDEIRRIHEECRQVYGSRKITQELNRLIDKLVNHKRVERIMKENGIRSKTAKKYKATTNSQHNLPTAPNIRDRNFTVEKHLKCPNYKLYLKKCDLYQKVEKCVL